MIKFESWKMAVKMMHINAVVDAVDLRT